MRNPEFILKPSKVLKYFIISFHFFSLLIILSLSLSIFWKIVFGVLLLIYGQQNYKRYLQPNNPYRILRIWQDSKGLWGYENANGSAAKGRLLGDSYKCRWFIILRIKTRTKSSSIFIPKDSISDIEYRILSNRLLFS
jgi:hypothetical protein